MPNFPYVPFQGRRIKGFDLLARYLWPIPSRTIAPQTVETFVSSTASESSSSDVSSVPTSTTSAAEFLLFLGDFVYADVPLYFGDDKEAYRRLYRRNYLSKSFRKIYERLRE
jgi:alkaline phosphatase D